MKVDEFVSMLLETGKLTPAQTSNLERLQDVSSKFHNDAGITVQKKADVDEDTIVLESGHQPNFLPYSGVWKKVFMLDFLKKKIEERGRKCIAVFGFADYNLASANLLYKNKVPALTRTGFRKIGFQASKDKWKAFNTILKPTNEDFEKEMESIRTFYLNSAKTVKYPEKESLKTLNAIGNEMKEGYERAGNFPDMNAFMISRICSALGFGVHFFRYSDIQKNRIFVDEWLKIIENLEEFNSVYMKSLRHNDVDINYSDDSLPFWYTCECGGIVHLSAKKYNPLNCNGVCPSCGRKHEFTLDEKSIEERFPRLSMNAVSRNMIVSEGLGDALYVSGSGGGLRYGKISNEISDALGFRKPITMSWKGNDFHLSTEHLNIIRDFTKHSNLKLEDILDKKNAVSAVSENLARLSDRMKELEVSNDRKSLFAARNEHGNIISKLNIIENAFGLKPSILDIFMTEGLDDKLHQIWTSSFSDAEISKENGFYIARNDTIYEVPGNFTFIEKENVVPICNNMMSLGELAGEKGG